MKYILILALCFFTSEIFAQSKPADSSAQQVQIVEASCGKCKFGMKADDCELAVRINGKAYVVDGTDIDEHGDAHADNGFCNAIRKAEVKGVVVNNKFKVSYFKLLPETPAPPKKQ